MADKNVKGFAALDEQIKKLNELGKLPEVVAPKIAKAAKEELKKQVAAQKGPDGRPWKPSKQGKEVLKNAGEAVRVTSHGTTIIMVVGGHYARHHLGAVKGKVKREILPNARIPETMTRAITKVVTGEFQAITGAKN